MNPAKLDEYRRAVAELDEAVQALKDQSINWDTAHYNYRRAKARCEKARAALLDPKTSKFS